MVADYYTKPLQGSLFRKMRDIVMGITPFPDEERVGLNEKAVDKVSIISGASGNCSDDVGRNVVGGQKIEKKSAPAILVGRPSTYADKGRTGKQ